MEKQRSAAVAKLNVNNPPAYSSPTAKPPVKPVEHNHTARLVGLPQEDSFKGNSAQSIPHGQICPGDPIESGRTKLQRPYGEILRSVYSR